MNEIIELTKINFSYVFISVFVILIGIKAVVSIFEWIIEKLGLETKWMRQKREEHELLVQTSQNLASLQEKHEKDIGISDRRDDEIASDIKKLTICVGKSIILLPKFPRENRVIRTALNTAFICMKNTREF